MDTMTAWVMSQAHADCELKVFDWDSAARIIKENNIVEAEAGLVEDWCNTGGIILDNGRPVDKKNTYTFLASNWATPVLIYEDIVIPCWVFESKAHGWDCDTYWPESALKILNGESEGE